MTPGDRIKALRLRRGLSVDDLAERIGKNRTTVYRYENNHITTIPSDVLCDLATVLGSTPGEIMGWTKVEESLFVLDYDLIPLADGGMAIRDPSTGQVVKYDTDDWATIRKANNFSRVADDLEAANDKGKPENDLREYLDVLRTRPECRMLFSLAKDATKEDVERAVAIIEALKGKG